MCAYIKRHSWKFIFISSYSRCIEARVKVVVFVCIDLRPGLSLCFESIALETKGKNSRDNQNQAKLDQVKEHKILFTHIISSKYVLSLVRCRHLSCPLSALENRHVNAK